MGAVCYAIFVREREGGCGSLGVPEEPLGEGKHGVGGLPHIEPKQKKKVVGPHYWDNDRCPILGSV